MSELAVFVVMQVLGAVRIVCIVGLCGWVLVPSVRAMRERARR